MEFWALPLAGLTRCNLFAKRQQKGFPLASLTRLWRNISLKVTSQNNIKRAKNRSANDRGRYSQNVNGYLNLTREMEIKSEANHH
jgi:hypothetical protein